MSRKALVIGLGDIGFKYDLNKPENIVQSHARAFSLASDFELVGGVDPDKSNREVFHATYAVPGFVSIAEACETVQPDVVAIASPTQNHLENMEEVLANCKPGVILMEKPAAYTETIAQKMLAMSSEASVPVLVNLIRRSDPSMQEIKALIDNGEIVTPCRGVVWYSKGLIHSACHFIDLLSWWLGDVSSVEMIDSGRRINKWDIVTDLRIRFGESDFFFLCGNSDGFNYYSVELLAQNGRLQIGPGRIRVGWQEKSEDTNAITPDLREISNQFHQYQLNVVSDIARYLDHGICSLPTLGEHVKSLSLVYDLAETWK